MQFQQITDEQLIFKLDQSLKTCKLFQLYLKDVTDDYAKIKRAKLKFEFAKHEYLTLLQEAKQRELSIREQSNMSNVLFN